MYFIVKVKHNRTSYVVEGENSTDAVLTAYKAYVSAEDYDDAWEEAGSGNALAEQLLAELFDCTETYRAMVLEEVERRLDGDRDINIVL